MNATEGKRAFRETMYPDHLTMTGEGFRCVGRRQGGEVWGGRRDGGISLSGAVFQL